MALALAALKKTRRPDLSEQEIEKIAAARAASAKKGLPPGPYTPVTTPPRNRQQQQPQGQTAPGNAPTRQIPREEGKAKGNSVDASQATGSSTANKINVTGPGDRYNQPPKPPPAPSSGGTSLRDRVAAAQDRANGVKAGHTDFADQVRRQAEAQNPTNGSSDSADLARLKAEHEAALKAAEAEARVTKEKALQQAGAKSGLAGLGLSGASAALQSDVSRTQDRTNTLTLADLKEKQRTEEWQALQRQIALSEAESDDDTDYDGDHTVAGQPVSGAIGNGNLDDDPDPSKEAAKVTAGFLGAGTKDDPYRRSWASLDADDVQKLVTAGMELTVVDHGTSSVTVMDQDGHYYRIGVPIDHLFDSDDWLQSVIDEAA